MGEVSTQVIHTLTYLCYKDFYLTSISPLQILVSCLKSRNPPYNSEASRIALKRSIPFVWRYFLSSHPGKNLFPFGSHKIIKSLVLGIKITTPTMFVILKNLQQNDCSLKKALSLNWWKSHCADERPYPSCCHPCGCVPASQPGNRMLTAHTHALFFLLSNVLALYRGIQARHSRGDGYEHGKGVGSEKQIAPFQGSRELWKCLMTSWGWSWIPLLG